MFDLDREKDFFPFNIFSFSFSTEIFMVCLCPHTKKRIVKNIYSNFNHAPRPRSYRRKIQQDALVKVNRVKENRRRGKDDLKITDNSIM